MNNTIYLYYQIRIEESQETAENANNASILCCDTNI